MSKLFEKMRTVANNRRSATSESKHPLLTHYYDNDVEYIDQDIAENDMQAGDTYVWMLKGNGCGTRLLRCTQSDDDTFQHLLDTGGRGSEYYLINVSAIGEGSVKQIDLREAQKANQKYPPSKLPCRRMNLFTQIDNLLGLGEKGFQNVSMLNLGSNLATQDGEKRMLRFSESGASDHISVQMLYVSDSERPKRISHFMVPKTIKGSDFIGSTGAAHLEVTGDKLGMAKVTPCTKSAYTKAVKAIEKSQLIESERSLEESHQSELGL